MANTVNTKFLDEFGLAKLWEKINTGFSPRWSAYKPSSTQATQEASLVKLPFSSAGILEVDGTKYGEPIVMNIPAATKTAAGVMTAADKTKLDNMSSSIDTAITLTDVTIDGTALTKTDKKVNIGFDYDKDTNMLRLLDNNNANGPTALATVDIDDIIGDTFKSSFLRDAAVVDRKDGETEATGMYIRLVFIVNNNTDGTEGIREIGPFYIDVDDLIDTYTAGTGIKIDTAANTGVDGIKSSHKISLKPATASAIGGVKIHKDNSSYTLTAKTSPIGANTDAVADDLRYYGVEIDKNDKAFVYMPPETVTVVDPTTANTTQLALNGTFNTLSGLSVDVNQDSGDILITPAVQPYKLPDETDVTFEAPATAPTSAGGLSYGGNLTVITGFTTSGTSNHKIKPVTSTYTLPSRPVLSVNQKPTTGIAKAEIIADNSDSVCAVVTNIEVTGDTIKPTYSNLWVNVKSIENSVIEALTYVVA